LAGIINSPGEKLIWLQSRWKWMCCEIKNSPVYRGIYFIPVSFIFVISSKAAGPLLPGQKTTSSLPVSFPHFADN